MYKTEKFRGELKWDKGWEFQRKYRCEKGKGEKRRRENFTAEYRCERKKRGGRITNVNGIVSVLEGGHIQGGESLCLCLLERAAF